MPSANSSKRDRIPALCYLKDFVTLQHAALEIAATDKREFRWKDVAAEFAEGLRVGEVSLLERVELATAYAIAVEPRMTIAGAIGFEGGWTYSR
jgi:hypothetical protein